MENHARIQRGGGTGGPDPLKNHQLNIGFLNNKRSDPLKITKLPSTEFNVWPSSARLRNAILILMAFRWRADDGLL